MQNIDLTLLRGWQSLDESQQNTILERTKQIEECRLNEAQSRISIGEHLNTVRAALPRKMWGNYLKALRFSRSTAYNYLSLYEATSKKLPKSIFDAAVQRGINSINLEVMHEIPVPKTTDPVKIEEYLDKIEQRPGRKSGELYVLPTSTDDEVVKCVRFCGAAFDKIGNRAKQKFIDNLGGMLLTRFGIASPKTFSPIAVPEKKKAA